MKDNILGVESMKMKITSANIKIDPSVKGPFQLRSKGQAKIKKPKDVEDKTALLSYKIKIYIPESELIDIELETNTIIAFEQVPSDYTKAGEDCLVEVQENIFTKLDEMLEVMGYPPLKLSDRYQESKSE